MRLFYENWYSHFANRSLPTNDLESTEIKATNPSIIEQTDIDLILLSKHISSFESPEFFINNFYKVGFTHHYAILAKEKSLDGRIFYVSQCAAAFWTVETLNSYLRAELYKSGTIPNNFINTLPEQEQARRAIRSFKDEYFLDYINIEDENEPDEGVFERIIITNIKKFILSFGNLFCYMGNQYRVIVGEEEFFIDLLFFNRELRCLVAIELKKGKFVPSYLGQLNFYLSALDEYVKLDSEMPSIGIVLCKEANRSVVEFAVRDYTKPMGVATFRTQSDMPEEMQKALPDVEDIRKLLETTSDEDDAEGE